MTIKHKHMSETVDDITAGWRRLLIGVGFFCLSAMMLWWWYCAIRATAPQMIDLDVSGNNRYSTILLVILLVFIVAVLVFSKTRPDVYLEVQHPCWSCNSNSSSANASAGVR